MKKLLSVILLTLPIFLMGQEHYVLTHVSVIQYDSIIGDGDINAYLTVSATKVDVVGDLSYQYNIARAPDSLGFTMLNIPETEGSESQNWQYRISPYYDISEDSLNSSNLYLIELFSFMLEADNNIAYMLVGHKKNLFPHIPRSIGDLDLTVVEYAYRDSVNIYTEKDYADQGAKGCYNSVKIRTKRDVVTFTFHLRKDYEERTLTNTKETYSYKIVENNLQPSGEFWYLEREDGVIVVFEYDEKFKLYSLTIPTGIKNNDDYIYIFSKTK